MKKKKGNIKMKYLKKYKINGSCDKCNKKSSIGNRLCNKCFWKIIGKNKWIS